MTKPRADAHLPPSPCAVNGCPAPAQRVWDEPDGRRRCVGHSTAPQAGGLRAKNAETGRNVRRGEDADEPVESAGENRRALIGAPVRIDLPPGKTWTDLMGDDDGCELLRAWLVQCTVLKQIDAPRARAALEMIDRIQTRRRESDPKSKWEGHPLVEALGIKPV